MNMFITHKNDLFLSAKCLDDARLNKQILECKTMYEAIMRWEDGEVGVGYLRHPVVQHYKDYPLVLITFGFVCCMEYDYRFGRRHALNNWFYDIGMTTGKKFEYKSFVPFYCQKPKSDPTHIRTTENTDELFQKRLCEKWDSDKAKGRPPKWTRREVPHFYVC